MREDRSSWVLFATSPCAKISFTSESSNNRNLPIENSDQIPISVDEEILGVHVPVY